MGNREQSIDSLRNKFDCIVIGGGINGAVSAAALSAHGLKVVLLEANDFASMTSQESSNMVWGGIKYLQDFEFRLVWKLCKSRNQLLKQYPNRINQIPFLAVIGETSPFSRKLGFLGAFVYWIFGRFQTHFPRIYSNKSISKILKVLDVTATKGAIQYNDAILLDNDSRFVYEFVKNAEKNGASVINYIEVEAANNLEDIWQISARDKLTNQLHQITGSVLINATGPFTRILNDKFLIPSENQIVISKGVHLIVPHIDTQGKVLAFFDDTGRLFYVLPMHDRTVIGTTDTAASNPEVGVTDDDREFLLNQANRCLNLSRPLTKFDVIAERCGVRPLVVKDASKINNIDWIALSRKHVVEINKDLKTISIFGGKITDCINVGNEVVQLVKRLGLKTSRAKNWFGEESPDTPPQLVNMVAGFQVENAKEIAVQLWRRHGKNAFHIVESWREQPNLSELVFQGLFYTRGELLHIARDEHVQFMEDLLRRRTPIALLRTDQEIQDAKLDLQIEV